MRAEFILAAALVALGLLYISSFTGLFAAPPTTHANRIIDGDTIEVAGPEKVRLLGIDTPEKGQFLYEEAKQRLAGLLGGKEIVLVEDQTDRDKYGRLLRYVFVNRTHLVNLVLVREGLARVLIIPPDDMYEDELLAAEREAKEAGLGLWNYTGLEDAFCIGIFYLRYNAMGDDRNNLNDEYVEFRNHCGHAVDMTGWTVEDGSGKAFVFPEFTAPPKEKFKLRTGHGEDSWTDVYWGKNTPVWNNAGDTFLMFNSNGQLMLNHTYEGY